MTLRIVSPSPPRGTAREISEHSAVPRTRVYDAIRVLESTGLVETRHSNPQQFRAVAITRRLMATGLRPGDEPETDAS